MKELAEDLAFSIPHMRRLQELGIRAMEVAEETAREEEASLARIRASLKDLPRGIDTSGMEQALDRVQGTLVSDLYGIAKDKLKYIIDDLAESIPRIDQECCKQMDEIGVRTEQIGLKVKAITEMLEDSNFNLPLDGYQRQMMNLLYNGEEAEDGFVPLSNVRILTTIEGMTADEKWELWKKRKTLGDKLEKELDNWFKNHPWSDLDWRFTKESEYLVQMDQMDKMKFEITTGELAELNDLMKKYGITSKESIAMFLATAHHESGGGKDPKEIGDEAYFNSNGYDSKTCGAGYIQVTGSDQISFLTYMKKNEDDPTKLKGIETAMKDGADRASFIANNYAWEASTWEWAVAEKGSGVVMNDYVNKHGAGENVFLVTQYFINSYLDKTDYPNFNNDLADIRSGVHYTYDYNKKWTNKGGKTYTGTLTINGREYRLPVNHKDRIDQYNIAMECFN